MINEKPDTYNITTSPSDELQQIGTFIFPLNRPQFTLTLMLLTSLDYPLAHLAVVRPHSCLGYFQVF